MEDGRLTSADLTELRQTYVPRGVFQSAKIFVETGKDAVVTDRDGKEYIDFAGGIGTLNVGHAPEELVQAISSQAARLVHACAHVALYEPYILLSKKLSEKMCGTGPRKTLLVNSGAEAVENAVKIARHFTGRRGVLTFDGAFHGRTMLALSLTSKISPYKKGFGPFFPEIHRAPYAYCYRCPFHAGYPQCGIHCLEYLEATFFTHVDSESLACCVVEPVLGEGGFVAPPKEFLTGLADLCKKRGILFAADEIQTGFGRTGRHFASEHFDLDPDLILTGKSLAGGLPLAAVSGRSQVMDSPPPGGLGGTYGGNPVACAAALKVLDLMEAWNLVEKAVRIGQILREEFLKWQEQNSLIGDVRGLGAMMALELVKDRKTKEPAKAEAAQVIHRCTEKGVLLIKAGTYDNVIRILSPLTIPEDLLRKGLDILGKVLAETRS